MVKISSTQAMSMPGLGLLLQAKKKHKYGAIRTKCLYGHNHDSKREAEWCLSLHQIQKEGKLYNLLLQPKYELIVNGIHIADHYPDFSYEARIKKDVGKPIHEVVYQTHIVEVKGRWEGALLPVWKLKYKLFCALYPEINYQVV